MDRDIFQEMAMTAETPSTTEGLSAAVATDEAFLVKARAFEKRARGTIQPLTSQFPWPTIAVFVAVLLALGAVSAFTIAGRLSYWVAVPVNAVLFYYIFTPLHEAVHGNIAGRTTSRLWLQSLIGHISGFLLLAPYPGFRVLHLHHHANTNDPVEDPDYWVKSDTYFGQLLRCMVIQPVYILHLWKIARDPRTMRAFVFEMAYVFSYPVIALGAYRFDFGNELMLLWFLPGYIGVVLCPLMFDWPFHHPHSERGRYNDSAILLFPEPFRGFMNVLFSGHSYHLMHHMYPRLPFNHYYTAWYALKDDLAELSPKVRDFTH